MSSPPADSVVQAVLDKFVARFLFGRYKYGTDSDREDLSILDWIQQTQEEHMDAILCLEKLKRTVHASSASYASSAPAPASSAPVPVSSAPASSASTSYASSALSALSASYTSYASKQPKGC